MVQEKFVIIVGGGIGGLVMVLMLYQIGVLCLVIEIVWIMCFLGVGINIQLNVICELLDLGVMLDELDVVGICVKEWVLVGLNGKEVYVELCGLDVGYKWF